MIARRIWRLHRFGGVDDIESCSASMMLDNQACQQFHNPRTSSMRCSGRISTTLNGRVLFIIRTRLRQVLYYLSIPTNTSRQPATTGEDSLKHAECGITSSPISEGCVSLHPSIYRVDRCRALRLRVVCRLPAAPGAYKQHWCDMQGAKHSSHSIRWCEIRDRENGDAF